MPAEVAMSETAIQTTTQQRLPIETLTYQSKLISAEEASETGCFTTLPIRLHPRDDLADAASRRFVKDWAREIGDGREQHTYFSFSPVGNWSSLIYPEAIPERLGVLAYLSDLGLIHDDGGEELSIEEAKVKNDELHAALDIADKRELDPESRAMKTKKLVSQCILECVNLDHELGLKMLAAFRDVWLAISEKNSDKQAQTIAEYLQYRSENGGMLVFWPMLQFSLGISLTDAEHELVQPIIDAATEGLLLANDYFSWEREYRELQSGHSQRIVSAVELFMRTKQLSIEAAKNEVKQRIIESERQFCQRRDTLYKDQPEISLKLKRWIDCAGLAVSGNHYWCSACPRQNSWKNESIVQNGLHTPKSNSPPATTNGNKRERPESDDTQNHAPAKRVKEATVNGASVSCSGVSNYPLYKPPSYAMAAPVDYISGMPSKGVRSALIEALNCWMHVPDKAIQAITAVVGKLHNASLILDDLEDNSPLRRGFPSAHTIFGQGQSINSANFMFVRAVQQVSEELNQQALTVMLEELEGLYLGQSWDLYWKYNLVCPTEIEYINMIDHKTGGMFRMLLRMMQAERDGSGSQPTATALDFERLTLLFGRFFQIRDDYMNFGDYASQKGLCEDLDEGKFSFPIVHCLTHHPEYRGHILGVFRQRPTVATMTASPLSKECKVHLMACLQKSGAFDKTLECLRDVEDELEAEIGRLEQVTGEANPMLRLCLAKLSVKGISRFI